MSTTAQTSTQARLALYATMLTIRRFEEAALELRVQEIAQGSMHLAGGQEAIPSGTLSVFGPEDRVVATYRGHGWAIACGVPLGPLMAEICQRASGINGGRGGSAYLSAPRHRFIGENSIVGAGVPIAGGVALAAKLLGTGGVAAVSFGDGATNQGATHEGIVMAVAQKLPVIFVCENNGWSEMTPILETVPEARLADRAAAYGLPAFTVDGADPEAVAEAAAEARARAASGGGPTFLECTVSRLWGHYNADVEHYRSDDDRRAAQQRDPLVLMRAKLLADTSEDALAELEEGVRVEVERARQFALDAPSPDPATARDHVVATPGRRRLGSNDGTAEELTFAQAVNRALETELELRSNMVVFGEDIGTPGGVFGVTKNLQKRFGHERVFDTPIAEAAILGGALGASLEGLLPVVEIMWADFLLVALDQLINQAANVRYISEGRLSAPFVVRCQQGVTPGSCAQHSQSLEALLAHVPGLRVGMPSTPEDAYEMTRAAIADPDPCILIESRAIYNERGPVRVSEEVQPIGGAKRRAEGGDVAIITWGRIASRCVEAAAELERAGVGALVLDLRWLSPLDEEAVAEAVAQTSRALIVHEANVTGGFGAEIAARVGDRCFDDLDAPIKRLGAPDVRFPSAPILQEALLPTVADIVAAARELVAL